MGNFDEVTEILAREFFKQFTPDADQTYLRIETDTDDFIISSAYIKNRYVHDVDTTTDDIQPWINSAATLLKEEFSSEFDQDDDKPCLLVINVSKNGSGIRFIRKNASKFQISEKHLGTPDSCHGPSVILPDSITNEIKNEFQRNKSVSSIWKLTALDKIEVKTSDIQHSTEEWLLEQPELVQPANETSGLQLTLYEDGSFYDEATNKELQLEWTNNDGELDNYHTTAHGKVSTVKGNDYLIPPEPSSSGTPLDNEQGFVRYDDGDTKVVDAINIFDNRLIRTVSVLTDGIYCDRACYHYVRADQP